MKTINVDRIDSNITSSSLVNEYNFPEDVIFEIPFTEEIEKLELDLELAESDNEYSIIYSELIDARYDALNGYETIIFVDSETNEVVTKGYLKK